jgi:DUF1680 family protein
VLSSPTRGDDASFPPPGLSRVAEAAAPSVRPFPLERVRLLDGPFRSAQDRVRDYLLSLDVDRLLHTFRLNAGIASTAAPLGGWEEPKGELRGHFTGHYLSACALMYAATGDERLKKKADALVAGLADVQEKLGPSGYLSAYPETFIDRVERRERVWAPYYTLHKILAGLLDVYVHDHNDQALAVAREFGDWVVARNAKLSPEAMQAMLGNEHGGMNESLANLYALTGERKYLDASLRFNHDRLLGPAADGIDNLTGLHANTQVPKFIGNARQYEITGQERLRNAARFFWDTVVHERSYVIGGHSDGEMFSPKETLSRAFGPNTTETCNTYNMIKLTHHLFGIDPRIEYADYLERALINHVLASNDPDTGMMCYYVPLRPGSSKVYSTRLDSFWCCTGTGVENPARYGESVFFHDGQRALYVAVPIASELKWPEKGLALRVETAYPASDTARILVTADAPVTLAIHLRHPSWVEPDKTFHVDVNGEAVSTGSRAGSWLAIDRTWKTGDVITLVTPFSLRTEGFRDNPNRLAFLNGPVVLAAEIKPERPSPVIVGRVADVIKTAAPRPGSPNTFELDAAHFRVLGGSIDAPVRLEPFYAMHDHRPYTVYFDVLNADAWQAQEDQYRERQERERAIDARTVDVVHPGREQDERDHGVTGERTSSGPFQDRHYRHATNGGWFSWKLRAEPNKEQEVWVTYWGDDAGARVFDVLLDGVKLATERLNREKPGAMFVRKYPVPQEVFNGRKLDALTLRFQAHPENYAGGVFEARIVRAADEKGPD